MWVDIHEVFHANEDIINLDAVDAPECIRTFVNLNYSSDEDSYFGKAQWTLPQGEEVYGGRILFQWKLNPIGAKDLITMDGTRQRHTKNWKLDLQGLPNNLPDCKFTFEEEKFPFHNNMDNELPNDDRSKPNQCPDLNSITSNGHFFTYDAVNLLTNGEFWGPPKYYANSNDKTNFLEYIRVAPIGENFNPPFTGLGKLIGSRASNKLPWSFARYTHKDQDFNLKPDNNVISLSHVRINQIPNDHTYYPITYTNEFLNHNYSVGRYNAIISKGQGEENEYLQIFLTRISADEHGNCNIYDENIDIENIPNSTTIYDLPFQNHTIKVEELENFDIIFLNWHTFRSSNKLNELKYGTHITNLNH